MVRFILLFIVLVLVVSCSGEERFIPKPPTYLRLQFPEREYAIYEDECSFEFNIPSYFKVKSKPNTCNKDIELQKLNGVIHLSVLDVDTSLAAYVNYAIDKVEEHKIKAASIKDTNIINSENKVYGTLFSLEGNVASPFQFYLTDSTSRFMSGVVYFNSIPNYDSIKPVLDFVKTDIVELMNSTNWKLSSPLTK